MDDCDLSTCHSILNAALVVWLGYKAVRRLVEIGLNAKK
jgi:hypothetical protein